MFVLGRPSGFFPKKFNRKVTEMSYRELRNFIEILRSLGYSKTISMEDFRVPNFFLVSRLLYWLVQRYQPNLDIPDNIATEADRIMFLKTIAQLIYYNARVKLNLKKIYRADGHAIRQLLKLATILRDSKFATYKSSSHFRKNTTSLSSQVNDKIFQEKIQQVRALSTELTSLGDSLHHALQSENQNKTERQNCIAAPHNMEDIKRYITTKNEETEDNIRNLNRSTSQMILDEGSLGSKKKTKINELERATKRFSRLNSFRPAFMDEYDKREKQLQELFTDYVAKYRNLEYLENELEKYRIKEEEERDKRQKGRISIVEKIRKKKEEEALLIVGEEINEDPMSQLERSHVQQRPSAPNERMGRRPTDELEHSGQMSEEGSEFGDSDSEDESEGEDDLEDESDDEVGRRQDDMVNYRKKLGTQNMANFQGKMKNGAEQIGGGPQRRQANPGVRPPDTPESGTGDGIGEDSEDDSEGSEGELSEGESDLGSGELEDDDDDDMELGDGDDDDDDDDDLGDDDEDIGMDDDDDDM